MMSDEDRESCESRGWWRQAPLRSKDSAIGAIRAYGRIAPFKRRQDGHIVEGLGSGIRGVDLPVGVWGSITVTLGFVL